MPRDPEAAERIRRQELDGELPVDRRYQEIRMLRARIKANLAIMKAEEEGKRLDEAYRELTEAEWAAIRKGYEAGR